jgi:predicted 3-demethylubiquinone-9 3-methyltransferase (glyoxalase superfamily)
VHIWSSLRHGALPQLYVAIHEGGGLTRRVLDAHPRQNLSAWGWVAKRFGDSWQGWIVCFLVGMAKGQASRARFLY